MTDEELNLHENHLQNEGGTEWEQALNDGWPIPSDVDLEPDLFPIVPGSTDGLPERFRDE